MPIEMKNAMISDSAETSTVPNTSGPTYCQKLCARLPVNDSMVAVFAA